MCHRCHKDKRYAASQLDVLPRSKVVSARELKSQISYPRMNRRMMSAAMMRTTSAMRAMTAACARRAGV